MKLNKLDLCNINPCKTLKVIRKGLYCVTVDQTANSSTIESTIFTILNGSCHPRTEVSILSILPVLPRRIANTILESQAASSKRTPVSERVPQSSEFLM